MTKKTQKDFTLMKGWNVEDTRVVFYKDTPSKIVTGTQEIDYVADSFAEVDVSGLSQDEIDSIFQFFSQFGKLA